MKTALKYTVKRDAETRVQELDTALGYPVVHGPEAQITPGIHVPAGVARTETCGAVVEQKDGTFAAVLCEDAIKELPPEESKDLIIPDRKEAVLVTVQAEAEAIETVKK